VETLRKTHSGVKVRFNQCLCGSVNGIKIRLEAQKCPTAAARNFIDFRFPEHAETHHFPLKRGHELTTSNSQLRQVLNQAAHAAVKQKGSYF
jgi:hypothetical protein